MKILCKLFGHKMHFDLTDVFRSLTCKRCGHTESGIDWNQCPTVPLIKEPIIPMLEYKCKSCNGKNSNRNQPCSCSILNNNN